MTEDKNREVHLDEQDAAAGSKEGVVRWVLLISTLAAALILTIIWVTGAVMEDDTEEEATIIYSEE